MRIFLDTNVLASAVATRGLCADVLREVLTRHDLIISNALLKELKTGPAEKIQRAFPAYIRVHCHAAAGYHTRGADRFPRHSD